MGSLHSGRKFEDVYFQVNVAVRLLKGECPYPFSPVDCDLKYPFIAVQTAKWLKNRSRETCRGARWRWDDYLEEDPGRSVSSYWMFLVSAQTPIFHLILSDLKLDIISGLSPESRFVRDKVQNSYFALPKQHIESRLLRMFFCSQMRQTGPQCWKLFLIPPASASIALWQCLGRRRISTYQDPHLGSSLKNINDILCLERRLEYHNTFKGPEDPCFHFSPRIFYDVPQRYNNEAWTLQPREIVYVRERKRPHFKCWDGREKNHLSKFFNHRIKSFFP